ncbi:hypothetical protein [Schleiferilactobacillus perolens]|jgi:hypothetical protein|uniref:hypothetical protein n=1 Tax=Schleiferilactobacillus perolens TaxID=100468 RepID=UPI002355CA85|nr:hypothetical protein [Schleiferilactobacillus perolens]MCI2170725.1 hypothetical protein [Schleiferilactobacillus perolens]
MDIQATVDRLNDYRKDAAQTRESYRSQAQRNTETMQPEYSREQNATLLAAAQKRLSRLAEDAQGEVNRAQTKFDKAIDDLFNNREFDANMAAQLDNLEKIDLTGDEFTYYARQFKDSSLAMRRLAAIAKDQGYRVNGPTIDVMNGLKNDAIQDLQDVADSVAAGGVDTNMTAELIATDSAEKAKTTVEAFNRTAENGFTVTANNQAAE